MKDVFALRKPSRALQLCIKIARIVLSIAEVSSVRSFCSMQYLLRLAPDTLCVSDGCRKI